MKRDLVLVALALMTWGVGEGMFVLFQPLYLEELGADPLLIGIIMGAVGVAMTIAHLPAGYLADRVDRRLLLYAAWILGATATWIMALAPSLIVFIIGSVLYGLTAFVISPLNSYITAARGEMTVGRVLTLISAAFNVGAIGGPLLGGLIGNTFGLRYNFLFAAIIFLISTIIIFFISAQPVEKPEETRKKSRLTELLTSRYIRYLLVVFFVMFCLYLPQPLSQNFLRDYRNLNLTQIGFLISTRSAGVVALNLFLGRLYPSVGFLLTQISMGLFTLLIWFGTGLPWYMLGYFLLGSYQTARSFSSAQARQLVESTNMGLAYGSVETVISAAVIIASPLSGVLYNQNPAYIYSVSFLLIVAAILVTLFFSPIKLKAAQK